MATANSVTTDLTTCSICQEMYDNPKSLPCLHAFCLRCLQSLCKDKASGDQASCPVCRVEFCIPQDGVSGLQHHFIVQQLVDKEKERMQGSYCDKHRDEQVKLYCHDCNENVCLMCSAVKHRNHASAEIPAAADNFRCRINDDDERILSVIGSVRKQSGQTKRDANEFRGEVEDLRKKVLATGDVVKRSVDDQMNSVLLELQSVRSESNKQAKSVREACRLAIVSMESFHTESQELLDKGRPSDVTRAAHELHNRATELSNSDVAVVKYRPPDVTFTPADVTQAKRLNLIGKLTVRTKEQSGVSGTFAFLMSVLTRVGLGQVISK